MSLPLQDIVLQMAFVMFTPVEESAFGWPGVPQLACTCKAAVSALKAARQELKPAHLAALNREAWRAMYTDEDSSDEDSTDE